MSNKHTKRRRRGMALVAAISFTAVVLALGLAVTRMATYESASSRRMAETIVSRNVAEGGVDLAMWKLKQDSTWRCAGNPIDFTDKAMSETVSGQTVTLGRYTVKPISTNADGTLTITADGLGNGLVNGVNGKTKTISMTVYQTAGGTAPFAFALLGGNSVKINNSIVTDSYNSANGVWTSKTAMQNGGVATLSAAANAMWNTNNPTIKGKVVAGAGAVCPPSTSYWAAWSQPNVLGGFCTFNSAAYNVSPPTLPAVTAPTGGTAFGSAYTTSPTGIGVYIKFNSPAFGNTMDNARLHDPLNNNYSWVVNGPKSGPALILNLTAINLTNQNSVTINGNVIMVVSGNVSTSGDTNFYINGSLMLYVGGTVTLANSFNNTAQRPKDFAILGLPSCTSILFTGNVPVCGYVYAPTATFTTSGSGDISGSIVANNIVCGGNAKIHYDESLGAITMGGGTGQFVPKTWEEDG